MASNAIGNQRCPLTDWEEWSGIRILHQKELDTDQGRHAGMRRDPGREEISTGEREFRRERDIPQMDASMPEQFFG